MVLTVDSIALKVLSAIGVTLPVFILAVDTFAENGEYDKDLIRDSLIVLVISGFSLH